MDNGCIVGSLKDDYIPGFTPVRRQDCTLYDNSPAISSHAPWTTSRCTRLIRPISSRIAILKKDKCQELTVANGAKTSFAHKNKVGARSNEASVSQKFRWPSTECVYGSDLERDTDRPPKRLKRTYTTKGRASLKEKENERHNKIKEARAAVKVPSPLVKREHYELVAHAENGASQLPSKEDSTAIFISSNSSLAQPLGGLNRNRRHGFRQIAKASAGFNWMVYDGLYGGVETLLRATQKSRPRPEKGARSLLSTCFKHIPELIAREQALEDLNHPDSGENVMRSIYDELESLAISVSTGWKPLKEVVRAHGIYMLTEAIRDGTIGPPIASELLKLCEDMSAIPEAHTLRSSILRSVRPLPRPSYVSFQLFQDGDKTLSTLKELGFNGKCWGYFYEHLTSFFRKGIIPLEYVSAHDMVQYWNLAIRFVTHNGLYAREAANFIRAIISLTYQGCNSDVASTIHRQRRGSRKGRKGSSSQDSSPHSKDKTKDSTSSTRGATERLDLGITRTVSNLIAVLFSVATVGFNLIEESEPGTNRSNTALDLLDKLAFDSLQYDEIVSWTTNHLQILDADRARMCMPSLARALVQHVSALPAAQSTASSSPSFSTSSALPTPEVLNLPSSTEKPEFDKLSTFICSLAACCSHVHPREHFGYMQRLVARLLELSRAHPANSSAAQLAVAAAFEFAEESSNKKHLEWALKVEEQVEAAEKEQRQQEFATGLGTADKRTNHSGRAAQERNPYGEGNASESESVGFRWEAAIGEWVARTPALKKQKQMPMPMPAPATPSLWPQHRSQSLGGNRTELDLEFDSRPESGLEPSKLKLRGWPQRAKIQGARSRKPDQEMHTKAALLRPKWGNSHAVCCASESETETGSDDYDELAATSSDVTYARLARALSGQSDNNSRNSSNPASSTSSAVDTADSACSSNTSPPETEAKPGLVAAARRDLKRDSTVLRVPSPEQAGVERRPSAPRRLLIARGLRKDVTPRVVLEGAGRSLESGSSEDELGF